MQSFDNLIAGALDGLSSSVRETRMTVAARVAWALQGTNTTDIMEEFDDEPLALLGFIEYCLQEAIPIPLGKLLHTFSYTISVYKERLAIIADDTSWRGALIRTDLTWLGSHIRDFIDAVESSSDLKVTYHAYIFRAQFLSISWQFQALLDHLESDRERLFADDTLLTYYVEAKEHLGDDEWALRFYPQVHYKTGSYVYLEKQIFLLIRLGREQEARQIHDFAWSFSDQKNKKRKPFIYYRGTIESDDDLADLPNALLDLYAWESFGPHEVQLIESADAYISRELKMIDRALAAADQREEDTLAEEFRSLQIRRLFLYEISSLALLHTDQRDEKIVSMSRMYIRLLGIYVAEYYEDPENSLLKYYFERYDHDWCNAIRDQQYKRTEDDLSYTKEATWVESESKYPSDTGESVWTKTESEDEFLPELGLILHRVANIIDFLYDRIENEGSESQEVLGSLRDIQNTLARQTEKIGFFDDDDTVHSGKNLDARLDTLSAWDLHIYARLSWSVIQKYWHTIRQMIVFFSLNSHVLQDMPLAGIKKDPKLLLFSLLITLLWDQFPSSLRIRDFLTHPSLEILSRKEMSFLCSLLYREWFYEELVECLLDNPHLLIYPEQIELLVLSMSYLDEVRVIDWMETLEWECLQSRYGTETLEEHIDMIRTTLWGRDARRDEYIDRLDHAQMWYAYMNDEDWWEADLLDTAPISKIISPLSASHLFSAVRMSPAPRNPSESHTYIELLRSIYPYAILEKREILLHILKYAFDHNNWEAVVQCISLAKEDKISLWKWIYAPYLLGWVDQERIWVDEIAQDNTPEVVPPSMMCKLYKLLYTTGVDTAQAAHTRFQLTYIFARQNSSIYEMLDAMKKHFQHIFILMSFLCDDEGNMGEERAQEMIPYFDSIGRDPLEFEDEDGESVDSHKNIPRLVSYLVRHIRLFHKFLERALEEEVNPEDIEGQQKIQDEWLSVLDEYERIFQLFSSETSIPLSARQFIGSLRSESMDLFSQKQKTENPLDEKNIYFSDRPIVF